MDKASKKAEKKASKKEKKVKKAAGEKEFGSELAIEMASFDTDSESENPLSRDSVARSSIDAPTGKRGIEDFGSTKEYLASLTKAERKAFKKEQKAKGSKDSRKNNQNDERALQIGHALQEVSGLSTNNRRIFDETEEEIEEREAKAKATEESGTGAVQVNRAEMNAFLQSTVFGVKVEEGNVFDEEEARLLMLKAKWGGILHPDTRVKGAYDLLQLVILLYLAWALPNRVAFTKTATGWQIVGDLVIDITVWVDMFLHMNMYYYDKKTRKLVTDARKIKTGYLKSWFLVDLFSVLPADQVLLVIGNILIDNCTDSGCITAGWTLLGWSTGARMLRLVRLLRLVKLKDLLNMDKIVGILYSIFRNLGVTRLQLEFYFRVFFLILIMLGGAHFLGCLWLWIGRMNVLQTRTPMGWMLKEYCQGSCGDADINHTKDYIQCIGDDFSAAEWNSKHGSSCTLGVGCNPVPPHAARDVDCSWIQDASEVVGATGTSRGVGAAEAIQYRAAFYFSLVTVSSVGYGDILPATPGEKKFVVFAILVGAFMYAYIIGEFTDLISNLKKDKSLFDAKMRAVNDLMAYIDAPIDLRTKVQDFYEFKFNNREGIDILDELPVALQTAMVKHRWGRLIAKVPFFKGLKDGVVVELCKRMGKFTVSPNDFIMEVGEHQDELLILANGTASTPTQEKLRAVRRQIRIDEGLLPLPAHHPDEVLDPTAPPVSEFDVGTFWGELQFLGLQEERTMSVMATGFCEIASLAPDDISDILLMNDGLRQRLQSYGAMRLEIEDKIAQGVEFDMDELLADLESRYKDNDDDKEEVKAKIKKTKTVRRLYFFESNYALICLELLCGVYSYTSIVGTAQTQADVLKTVMMLKEAQKAEIKVRCNHMSRARFPRLPRG
eukprot:COSAG05_NODE_925_length_6575_cov_68.709320_2_plen_893_part_00